MRSGTGGFGHEGPVLYDPETDTLLVEIKPWPGASSGEINEEVGGEDAEEGLVVRSRPQAHAYEIADASARPQLVARALNALRAAKDYAAA
jgi:hypothetical protein